MKVKDMIEKLQKYPEDTEVVIDGTFDPESVENVEVGDIVYCKVNGKFYTHLVKAVDANKGCLIGNNRGRINGWTKSVYAKVVEVL